MFFYKLITIRFEANSVHLFSELSENNQAPVGLGPELRDNTEIKEVMGPGH